MGGFRGSGSGPGGTLPDPGNIGNILQSDGAGSWVANDAGEPIPGDILVFNGEVWVPTNSATPVNAATNLAQAIGRWEPESLHNDGGGTVDYWTNLGTGGPQWSLTQATALLRPTYDAIGNRAGGPAATFVRLSATKLRTPQQRLAPCTYLCVAKVIDVTLNQRIMSAIIGNSRDLYVDASQLNGIIAGGGNPAIAGMVNATWYGMACVFTAFGSINLQRGVTTATAASAVTVPSGTEGLVLGDFGTAGGAAFGGTIERAYVWNKELTTVEITAIFTLLGV